MVEQETITLHGAPFFIYETESRIFKVVKALTYSNEGFSPIFNEEIGGLRKGLEIKESSNRGLELKVDIPIKRLIVPYVIQKLRAFAEVSDQDFFSYEPFGNFMCELITTKGDIYVYKIAPRIFRKNVDNCSFTQT